MFKYFVFYRIAHHNAESEAFVRRHDLDVNKRYGILYQGFDTKAAMLRWIEENNKAIMDYQMLKPI